MQFDFLSAQGVDTRTKQMAELTQERGFSGLSGGVAQEGSEKNSKGKVGPCLAGS